MGDSIRYRKKVKAERVFKFLVGLNKRLDDVWGRILDRQQMTLTREVFVEVRCEERRGGMMLRKNGEDVGVNSSLNTLSLGLKQEIGPLARGGNGLVEKLGFGLGIIIRMNIFNKKDVLSVITVGKIDTQRIHVGNCTENLWIGNQDKPSRVVVIKSPQITRMKNLKI